MVARAEYEKELEELGSQEEDDLQVFDEEMAVDEEPMGTADGLPEETRFTKLDKGKGRASGTEQSKGEEVTSSKRKRPRVDPYASELHPSCQSINQALTVYYGERNYVVSESISQTTDDSKKAKLSTPVQSLVDTSRGDSVSVSEDREARKAVTKAKRKAKKALTGHET